MTVSSVEFETILENEWYAVRHSGEIPEIALCSAFYYLVEDRSGPRSDLNVAQSRMLVEAAEEDGKYVYGLTASLYDVVEDFKLKNQG